MRVRPFVAPLAGFVLLHLLAPTGAAAKRKHGSKGGKNAPVPALTRDGKPNVLARSAIVIDLKSGEELYVRNADEVRAIASLSKLMAVMAVLDANIPLETTTAITEEDRKVARGGAKSRLLAGMTFTNRDLIHAALLASDNRSIPAMGRGASMTPQELTAAMNKKAQELGLEHTHFEDPTGLNPGNVSTAREQVKALKAALGYPLIAAISRKAQHDVTVVDGKSKGLKIRMFNTDRVARAGKEHILGGKTGYNDLARYCLVIAARIDGREYSMAFLGVEGKLTRFGDFHRVSQWLTQQRKTAAAPATQKRVQ
jgi:serine-type D-Ala-D-Ala endopeptidase (penicillin-binding protein 7)